MRLWFPPLGAHGQIIAVLPLPPLSAYIRSIADISSPIMSTPPFLGRVPPPRALLSLLCLCSTLAHDEERRQPAVKINHRGHAEARRDSRSFSPLRAKHKSQHGGAHGRPKNSSASKRRESFARAG